MNVRAAQKKGQHTHELISELKANKHIFIAVGIFSCIGNILMLTGPLFMLQVYDRVLASRSLPTLIALISLVAGLYAFLGVFEYIRSRILTRAGLQLDENLQRRVFSVWLKQGLLSQAAQKSQPLNDLATIR